MEEFVEDGPLIYDLVLASLFLIVVLSPLAINAWLDWAEAMALRREVEEAGLEIGAAVVE